MLSSIRCAAISDLRPPGRRALIAASLVFAFALPACTAAIRARLTNPSVQLALTHPPGFGLLAERVAFGPPRGGCSDEIVSNLTTAFLLSDVEVVDLAVFDAAAAGAGAAPDAPGGPTLLIDINATLCEFEQDRRTATSRRTVTVNDEEVTYEVIEFISETTAHLRTAVRVTDLGTGRVRAVRTLAYSPIAERRSEEDYPEFPSGTGLLDEAIGLASAEAEALLLPRTAFASLVFFDDETCGLDAARSALDAGDWRNALRLSEASLERCGDDPATAARAQHNMGVVRALRHDYLGALRHFRAAAGLDPGNGVFTDAIALAIEAEELAESMRRLRAPR